MSALYFASGVMTASGIVIGVTKEPGAYTLLLPALVAMAVAVITESNR